MPLNNITMAEILNSLVRLDIKAVYVYRQIIQTAGAGGVKNQLIRFRTDHERHIYQLSAVIRALDREPPLFAPDSKAGPVERDSSSRGLRTPETSLYALRLHEQWANQLYGESCSRDFTPGIKALVLKMYVEEQRHLRYVEDVFSRRRVKRMKHAI
jgi:rubrerythrin